MRRYTSPILLFTVITIVATRFDGTSAAQTSAVSPNSQTSPVEVTGGTVAFEAGTNISAINVHGKSTNLRGRARIRQDGSTIAIEQLQAAVPVKTLVTGLGLRDEHMRKYIFTTGDGQTPDLTFAADSASCAAQSGSESVCKILGQLVIRGTARPFTMTLRVSRAGEAYRASGDGAVRLSSYGIDRPSQLGVTTTDDVKLHLEFTAKPSARQVAAGPGGVE